MPRTMIGNDSDGIGAIKIMKNNADDPRTTPDSHRWKFLYNSKNAIQTRIWGARALNYRGGGLAYTPAGSGAGNYQTVDELGIGYARNSFFPGMAYNLPLFDVKVRSNDYPNRYKQNRVQRRWSGSYYQDQGGYYSTMGNDYWARGLNTGIGEFGYLDYGFRFELVGTSDGDPYNYFGSRSKSWSVWQLPGNNLPLNDARPVNEPGKMTISITSSALKIAKPGYDANTAFGTQLAFNSTDVGAKIIAAADVAMPSGESFYDTGIALPASVLADVDFYTGTTVFHPTNPKNAAYGADYEFVGSSIRFYNGGGPGRARFMIYASDDTPPTAGSNNVIRQVNIAGTDVVQFLRPGAAANPAFADIVIDSRWPAVQLLDEGYIPITGGSQVDTRIVDATGMFLKVKFMVCYPARGGSYDSFQEAVFTPVVRTLVMQPGYVTGDSAYCTIEGGTVKFYTFLGSPIDYYRPRNGRDPMTYSFLPVNPVGLRYYIFGIPN